jgi:hypothetical protein
MNARRAVVFTMIEILIALVIIVRRATERTVTPYLFWK